MTTLLLLRHGPTSWNNEHRIQGRTDIGLTGEAREELATIKLSTDWHQLHWFSSPLLRAQQTAQLLGPAIIVTEPALIEMNWGEFEGMRLNQIEIEIDRQKLDPPTGLDLTPPSGESPRMVKSRFANWLKEFASGIDTDDAIAVTHKGVIRAALSLATGWDMQNKFPQSIDWRLPLAFSVDYAGRLELDKVNCGFTTEELTKLKNC